MKQRKAIRWIPWLLALILSLTACAAPSSPPSSVPTADGFPVYQGKAYTEYNNNDPQFKAEEITTQSFEEYAPLDSLERCGVAFSCIGKDLMPTEERGSIGQIKPSGWHTVKYDCVDGKYLYNRCHLIGFQLTGENANPRNLITGTRYLNVEGMLPFENMVADYIKETGNHVMYRVTPEFFGNELVARGVRIEALSVEDQGEGISFHVYCFNVQPGIQIRYADGESAMGEFPAPDASQTAPTTAPEQYILNTSSKKIHMASCSYAKDIAPHNRKEHSGSYLELLEQGYSTCKSCF